jgi:isoleucyl-tRNA synthetase
LRLEDLVEVSEKAYKNFTFTTVYKNVINFVVNDLSSFYFELCKDTLYLEPTESYERKKTLTVLNTILNYLLILLSPILPHTTEEIYQELIKTSDNKKIKRVSVHMSI